MTSLSFPGSGILNDADITSLVDAGVIEFARPRDEDQIQPASLDLRLGKNSLSGARLLFTRSQQKRGGSP